MRCGSFAGAGENCDGDLHEYGFNACVSKLLLCNASDSDGTPLHCNRAAGRCTPPTAAGGWCDDESHCASKNCDYGSSVCL